MLNRLRYDTHTHVHVIAVVEGVKVLTSPGNHHAPSSLLDTRSQGSSAPAWSTQWGSFQDTVRNHPESQCP